MPSYLGDWQNLVLQNSLDLPLDESGFYWFGILNEEFWQALFESWPDEGMVPLKMQTKVIVSASFVCLGLDMVLVETLAKDEVSRQYD